eukprot:augustus_masked-scaffold_75-processed-gene-0.8-mRNA-1 protein AED:0.99 eAED:1.00 QI:0/-1/0/1/-1/1/1/0/721
MFPSKSPTDLSKNENSLLINPSDGEEPFLKAFSLDKIYIEECIQCMELLVEYGFNLNGKLNNHEGTILQYSAINLRKEKYELFECLFKMGANFSYYNVAVEDDEKKDEKEKDLDSTEDSEKVISGSRIDWKKSLLGKVIQSIDSKLLEVLMVELEKQQRPFLNSIVKETLLFYVTEVFDLNSSYKDKHKAIFQLLFDFLKRRGTNLITLELPKLVIGKGKTSQDTSTLKHLFSHGCVFDDPSILEKNITQISSEVFKLLFSQLQKSDISNETLRKLLRTCFDNLTHHKLWMDKEKKIIAVFKVVIENLLRLDDDFDFDKTINWAVAEGENNFGIPYEFNLLEYAFAKYLGTDRQEILDLLVECGARVRDVEPNVNSGFVIRKLIKKPVQSEFETLFKVISDNDNFRYRMLDAFSFFCANEIHEGNHIFTQRGLIKLFFKKNITFLEKPTFTEYFELAHWFNRDILIEKGFLILDYFFLSVLTYGLYKPSYFNITDFDEQYRYFILYEKDLIKEFPTQIFTTCFSPYCFSLLFSCDEFRRLTLLLSEENQPDVRLGLCPSGQKHCFSFHVEARKNQDAEPTTSQNFCYFCHSRYEAGAKFSCMRCTFCVCKRCEDFYTEKPLKSREILDIWKSCQLKFRSSEEAEIHLEFIQRRKLLEKHLSTSTFFQVKNEEVKKHAIVREIFADAGLFDLQMVGQLNIHDLSTLGFNDDLADEFLSQMQR